MKQKLVVIGNGMAGMKVVEDPDLEALRTQVADLKNIDLFKEEKVQALLLKVLEATN